MIRVLLVDDEKPALKEMSYLLQDYPEVEIVGMLQDGRETLQKITELKPDAIFLDIDMPGVNGLELAMKIQELHAGVMIIFVTAYSEYALDAFRAYPLDYIMKPVNKRRFDRTMQHLEEQLGLRKSAPHNSGKAQIHCFGNFEVFTEDGEKKYMKYATRQTKEMFAYLIAHFERTVTRKDLILDIFGGVEDKKTVSLLYVTAYNLRHALENIGVDRNSVTIDGKYSLRAESGVCDYIDFARFTAQNPVIGVENVEAAEQAAELYHGAFLENEDYFWAEEIRAEMEVRLERLLIGIADCRFEMRKTHGCEKALITLIRLNPLSDGGNRALLDLYMKTGNVPKFREHYEKYACVLQKEFTAAPAQKYADFYSSAG